MRRSDRRRSDRASVAAFAGLVAVSAVAVSGCGGDAVAEPIEPYELTPIDEELNLVRLTPKASERLRMAVSPVTEQTLDGRPRLVVPYAALVYDTAGATWVYVRNESLTYHRSTVSVDRIEDELVYLFEGPAPGTEVAVTSVAELYGADTGVGK